ncbi:MAG TPA: BTAD domain-containing putative transcriptional regulator, partial [Acidimicrobiales bacterium]|nr:BTAD domain-containing putative transcriptional regulator [Acidimicrobiales bacterium]
MALACRVGVLAGLPEGLAPLLATAGALEGAGAVSLQNLVDRLWAGRNGSPASAGADAKSNGVVEGDTRWTGVSTSSREPESAGSAISPGAGLPGLQVHCFGPFEAWLGERPVDLSAVKPRARAVLQLLAVGAGRPVHRDELLGALWPDDDLRSGTRNLQVAISSLRQALDKDPASPSFIGRDGEAYLVALRPGDEIDVATFTDAVRVAGAASRAADVEGAIAAGWKALGEYRGELLAGGGSGEWIVERRERFRLTAAEVAQTLAVSLVEAGDPAGAVAAAERGLTIDRYRDGLWRALIAALDANGDRAAAAKAALDYEAVLAELGVTS